jgi:peptide/nickel transport system substrate-binding protein
VDFARLDQPTAQEAEAAGFKIHLTRVVWAGLILGDHAGAILPAIGDLRVRQAISMAFDRDLVADTIDLGFGDASNQLAIPGGPDYVEELADTYEYDPETARALLAEAGYPDGFDLPLPKWGGSLGPYEPYITQALGEIGIRVQWEDVNADVIAALDSGKYAVWTFPQARVDPAYDPPLFLEVDAIFNPWKNVPDAEAAEILATIDSGTEDEILDARKALAALAIEEAWFAVVAHPAWPYGYNSNVELSRDDFYSEPHLSIIRPAD